MQFHIDIDTPDMVAGWLVPTHPDSVSAIVIGGAGREPIALRANVMRSDIVALGAHATGMVGFHVSLTTVPGLQSMEDLELRDAETSLVIYRRKRPGDRPLKIARFTQGYGVQPMLDRVLARHVTLSYDNCGEYPFATLFGLFNNRACPSISASGAFFHERHYALMAERGFITTMLLKDPVAALAETLLAIQARFGRTAGFEDNSTQYLEHFAAWFGPAQDRPLADQAQLDALFAQLTAPQRLLLSNPAVRLLACKDEPAAHRHVASALEHLADFHLVGTEDLFTAFQKTLLDYTGSDLLDGFVPAKDPAVQELAAMLSRNQPVMDMLQLDFTLYDLVRNAIAGAA